VKPGDLVEIGSAYCEKTKKRSPYIAMVIKVHKHMPYTDKGTVTGYILVNGKYRWATLSMLKKVEL
jgi:hypothetical protein